MIDVFQISREAAFTVLIVLLLNRPGVGQPHELSADLHAGDAVYFESDHLWNRLHHVLFVRRSASGMEFGHDVVDPLLWKETRHLLEGSSHRRAIRVLDEFLEEESVSDAPPNARALLQQDLWALFDWTVASGSREGRSAGRAEARRRELRIRVARALLKLALTRREIEMLPDNYAVAALSGEYPNAFSVDAPQSAFLPGDLFDADGPWIRVTDGQASDPLPVMHVLSTAGRSTFLVFVRFAGGRAEAIRYLDKLASAGEPWRRYMRVAQDPDLETTLPELPPGAQFVLVRRMNLIAASGELVTSPITQSVQLQVHRQTPGSQPSAGRSREERIFFEFILRKRDLLKREHSGLHAVEQDERRFTMFLAHAPDPFESKLPLEHHRSEVLQHCADCHRTSGVASFLSYTRQFAPLRGADPPMLQPDTHGRESLLTREWKLERREWGQLQGLFDAAWTNRRER